MLILVPFVSALLSFSCRHSISSNLTKHDALLVIDVQNDFMEAVPLQELSPQYPVPDDEIVLVGGRKYVLPGALAVKDTNSIVDPINKLMKEFDENGASVFLSLDWHTQEHCSFCRNGTTHTNTSRAVCGPLGPNYPPNFDSTGRCQDITSLQDFHKRQLMQWPDHCVENSFGARFTPYLELPQNAVVVKKGFLKDYDSYSAFSGTLSLTPYPFWDNDTTPSSLKAEQPSLGLLLAQRDIRRLFLVGVATDFCVRMSALDAMAQRLGEVVLITSAARGVSQDGVDRAKTTLRDASVKVLSTDATSIKNILTETCDYDTSTTSGSTTTERNKGALVALGVLLALFVCATVVLLVMRLKGKRGTGTEYVMAR
jgi:nicotinamidase/pyrazinamidase